MTKEEKLAIFLDVNDIIILGLKLKWEKCPDINTVVSAIFYTACSLLDPNHSPELGLKMTEAAFDAAKEVLKNERDINIRRN